MIKEVITAMGGMIKELTAWGLRRFDRAQEVEAQDEPLLRELSELLAHVKNQPHTFEYNQGNTVHDVFEVAKRLSPKHRDAVRDASEMNDAVREGRGGDVLKLAKRLNKRVRRKLRLSK